MKFHFVFGNPRVAKTGKTRDNKKKRRSPVARKRHRKNPLKVQVKKHGKVIKTWLAPKTPGELKREKKAVESMKKAASSVKNAKLRAKALKEAGRGERSISHHEKALKTLSKRMKEGKKRAGLKFAAKKIAKGEYRNLLKMRKRSVKKIRKEVSAEKARENLKKFLAASSKKAARRAKKSIKKGKKTVAKKKSKKTVKKVTKKRGKKAVKKTAKKPARKAKKHVRKHARKAKKHGRRKVKKGSYKFAMSVPRSIRKGESVTKTFKKVPGRGKKWRKRFLAKITRKNPFGGSMDIKSIAKELGKGQLAHRSYMDAGILVGAAAVHRPISMYVAKYLPGYNMIAENLSKALGEKMGSNLAAVLPGMIGAAVLGLAGHFTKKDIVKKLADDVAAVNLVILGTAVGEGIVSKLPGLQGYPALRGYPTLRGVDFTPMSGVDFTPSMGALPTLAGKADFGRSSADFGRNPDFGGVDFTPSMSGGDESMDFDPEDNDPETGEHLG